MTIETAYEIIKKFARTHTRDFEDLTQDVSIKILNHGSILTQPESKIKAYIYVSVRNAFIDTKRKQIYTTEVSASIPGKESDNTLNELIEQAGLNEIERMWLDIYLDQGSYDKVAEVLDCDRMTVFRKIKPILNKCKKYKQFL